MLSSPKTTRALGKPGSSRPAFRANSAAAAQTLLNWPTAARAGARMRLDGARLLDAHASGGDPGLALAASEPGSGRTAAEAHRQGKARSAVERRVRLDRRLRRGK